MSLDDVLERLHRAGVSLRSSETGLEPWPISGEITGDIQLLVERHRGKLLEAHRGRRAAHLSRRDRRIWPGAFDQVARIRAWALGLGWTQSHLTDPGAWWSRGGRTRGLVCYLAQGDEISALDGRAITIRKEDGATWRLHHPDLFHEWITPALP